VLRLPAPLGAKGTWIPFSLLTAVVAGICFGSLTEHLLDTHDAESFSDNLAISEDFSFFFSANKQLPSGRPLAELSKWLAYLIWGNDPSWFHLLVIMLHAVASVLLAVWAYQAGFERRLAYTGSLLFLVNVAHFRAVHYISALDYPLATALALGALICCGRYFLSSQFRWVIVAVVLLSSATMAHLGASIALPVCIYWGFCSRLTLKRHWRALVVVAAVELPLAAYLLISSSSDTSTGQALLTYGTDGATELSLGFWRVLLWLAGRCLTTAHWVPMPLYHLAAWELYAGAAVLAALLLVAGRRRVPEAVFACWTILALVPFAIVNEQIVLNLPAGPSRYLYLASAGSSLLLAKVLWSAARRCGRWKELAVGIGLATVVFSSYVALKRAEAISLYTSARSYVARNEIATGIDRLRQAVAMKSGFIDLEDAYDRLCFLLIGIGEDGTRATLAAATRRFPDHAKLHIYQQVMSAMDPDSLVRGPANARLTAISRLAPGNGPLIAQAFHNAGDGHYRNLEIEAAIKAYKRSLRFDPERLSARINLGWGLLTANRPREAIEQYNLVLFRGPHSIARFNIALCLLTDGAYDEARTAYREAFERYGLSEAERLGVDRHLELLRSKGSHSSVAREIYRTYWSADPAARP
jgi:tetratricopeptide (TPR) repeat protein